MWHCVENIHKRLIQTDSVCWWSDGDSSSSAETHLHFLMIFFFFLLKRVSLSPLSSLCLERRNFIRLLAEIRDWDEIYINVDIKIKLEQRRELCLRHTNICHLHVYSHVFQFVEDVLGRTGAVRAIFCSCVISAKDAQVGLFFLKVNNFIGQTKFYSVWFENQLKYRIRSADTQKLESIG